jgi:hypothetical protein
MTADPRTTIEVSLSNRYSRMTAWQPALKAIVRTLRPLTSCLPFQKPTSALKARTSRREWASETAMVRARKYGLPSVRMRFRSSGSPSFIAPHDCCSLNDSCSWASIMCCHDFWA